MARPPSNLYRFQKLVRRNKLAFTAASAVTAALLVGFGISTWMFSREGEAKREQARLRQQSVAKEKKAQQIAQFLKDMLAGAGPEVALGRDVSVLQEILDKTAERVGKELTNQPDIETDLRQTLGETYFRLGDLEKAKAMY